MRGGARLWTCRSVIVHVCDILTDLLHVLLPVYMPFMRYTVPTHEAAFERLSDRASAHQAALI